MDQIARSLAGGVSQEAFKGVAVTPGLAAAPLRSPTTYETGFDNAPAW